MDESTIAMAQRHVVEGSERIARQESMIAELDRDGHEGMLPDAHAILNELRDTQKMSEEHLGRLLAKQGRS